MSFCGDFHLFPVLSNSVPVHFWYWPPTYLNTRTDNSKVIQITKRIDRLIVRSIDRLIDRSINKYNKITYIFIIDLFLHQLIERSNDVLIDLMFNIMIDRLVE